MDTSCPIRPVLDGTGHPGGGPAELPLHPLPPLRAAFVPFISPRPAAIERTQASHPAFLLFLLLNAVLFVRPAEIVPYVIGWPIYEVLVVACLAVSFPPIWERLSLRSLAEQPITACVIGLVAAVVLSHLFPTSLWHARMSGWDFSKVVVYYLLLIGIVDSPQRLRRFLLWLVAMSVVVTALAVLQYHGTIDIPALAAVEQGYEDRSGQRIVVRRMVSTGIFNDPNDLCLILVLAVVVCLHELLERGPGSRRFLWLGALGLFGYALMLTHSRGGFISLLAALAVLLRARLGWLRATLLAGLLMPVLYLAMPDRQTDLSLGAETGQERVQIWSDALVLLREAPMFGIGYGIFYEETGRVVHNSFLHCFTELGFLGGTLFLGAFAFALYSLHRLGTREGPVPDERLRGFRPYVMALTVGYAAGMLSLSRAYVVPTYLVLGLAVAYGQLAWAGRESSPVRLSVRTAWWIVLLGVAFVLGAHVFVRLFVRWG